MLQVARFGLGLNLLKGTVAAHCPAHISLPYFCTDGSCNRTAGFALASHNSPSGTGQGRSRNTRHFKAVSCRNGCWLFHAGVKVAVKVRPEHKILIQQNAYLNVFAGLDPD